MSEISRLATTDKDIVDMWSVIIKIVYTLIVGAIGGACTFWWNRKKYLLDKQKLEHEIESSIAKIESDKKSIRQQMITNNIAPMRQEWINDVRNKTSEFLSLCYVVALTLDSDVQDALSNNQIEGNKEQFNYITRLLSIYNNLILLLPQNEDESIQIKSLLEKAMSTTIEHTASKNIDDLHRLITMISNKVQSLLKKEWEVTKSLKEIE